MVTGFVNRVGRRFASAGHFLCVAIAAGLISPLAGAAPVPLVADAGQPRFSAVAAGRQMTWDFFAALGPDSRPLRLKWVPNGARKWETEVDTDAGPIHISLEASPLGAWTAIELFIRNEQKSLLLCEVGWHAAAALEQSRFWGGWNTVLANRRYEAEGPVKVYPLQAIYDNKASLATALFPSELVSYLRVAGDTSTRPAGLETAVRCVVDPGSQARLNFVLGAFETQWGYLEALHHYYTAFPQWFTPYPGVDPRASLNGGSYLIWRDEPMCDLARRLQVGWEWCYAPFRRTGDIFGRPEFWDYSPARPMAAWRAASIDEVHKWRKQRFAQGDKCDVLMAFYIPSQIWCEEQLARERYADALIDDPRAKTYFDTPWVTGHDNELRVFPLNTSFGAQSLVDMADVAKELDLGAFAFDVAGGGARYYGPAVPRCPARAWDERGVFVEEAVAIASLIDWVHQQKTSEGRPVAAIINPGAYSSYMTTFRCDSSMLESSPDSIATGLAQCLRPRLGHKTMVLWETYEYEEWLRPDLSQAEYIDALRGIADWTVQACFQVVALPTPRIAMGLTPIVQWLPVLRDMVLAGWEPVPAAIRDDGSWVSRAGSSLGCFLATGNATRQDRPVQLYVDDAWIGDGNFLWAAVGPRKPAGPVEHAVWPNKPTAVHATIPPRQPLVLQSVATLRKLSGNIRAAVSRDGDSSRQTLTLRFDGRSTGELAFAVPPYFAVTSVTVDGKPVESVTSDGGRATMPLRVDGSSTVAVELRSLACRVSEADLQAFPQLVGDRMDFSVALDVNAGDHVMRSANWIANYFSTYFARAADPPARIKPARIITYPTEAQNENAKLIRLTLVDGRKLSAPWEITMPDQRTLVVAAQDDRALTDGVRHLLSVWDKKFVWAGPLPPLSMLKRVGLAGKQLPAD